MKVPHAPGDAILLYLPVQPVSTTTGTILLNLESVRVIFPVLGGSISPVLALGTGQINNTPCFAFLSHNLLYDAGEGTSTYGFTSFTNSKT